MKSIFRYIHIWVLPLVMLTFTTCGNFEKEVEIDVPEFKSQLAVEAYIESNKAIKVAVTETQDYFGELGLPFVNDANVTLIYNGVTYPLSPNLPDLKNFKYFNYILRDSFIFQPGDVVHINVIDKKGRMVTAESRWLNPVKIDSVRHIYGPRDSLALITVHFNDPPGAKNFYRFRVINRSDSDRVIQDFFTNDGPLDGQKTAFGTGYRFSKNDTLEVTLFTLTEEFFRYLETAEAAQSANGNPFGQPAVIKTNIVNGTGIFTVLPFDRKEFIIP